MFSIFPYSSQPYSSIPPAGGVVPYQWDTSQGKAPSNYFTPLRQTVVHVHKAKLTLKTAKVVVKAVVTPVPAPAVNITVQAKVLEKAGLKSGFAKLKIYSSSVVSIKEQKTHTKTRAVFVYRPNIVCANLPPKTELVYSVPNVFTSSATVVSLNKTPNCAKLVSYKANVKAVQNPTDDELRAIMLLIRQQKLKQAAMIRKMM